MRKKKHKPKSRIEYEENNPVISVRMPKEWVDELDAFLNALGLSRGDFFRIAFEKQKADYEMVFNEGLNIGERYGSEKGYNKGFNKGKEDYGILFPCSKCGGLEYVLPNSDIHKTIIDYLKLMGSGHDKCNQK
jgi:hypothetical protein